MTEPVRHEVRARIDRGASRGAERIALVGAILILVALVKPWGQPAASPEPARPERPIATVPPTAAAHAVEPKCYGSWWLIEADEAWAGHFAKVRVLTDAVEATGPDDPTIPFVLVAAEQVVSLGYCPANGEGPGPITELTIYRLSHVAEVVPTVPFPKARDAGAAANELYRPEVDSSESAPPGGVSWPEGRYVFRIDGPDDYQRWLGVDIRLITIPGSVIPGAG